MNPILAMKNVSYSYHTPKGETKALSDISFSVEEGSFTSIVGPSGCGKSTLLSLISGLIVPDSGDILINDIPADKSNMHIGYMLQKDQIYINNSVEAMMDEKRRELMGDVALILFPEEK